MTLPVTTQFKETQTPSGKKAIEAYCAVWEEGGIAICAPTIAKLEAAWKLLTATALPVPLEAQRVWIVKA